MKKREASGRQMLSEALEAMGLTEKNQKLAEQYFDMEKPENESLLKKAELQNYHELGKAGEWKRSSYINYLRKGGSQEEEKRFIRFTAATGGSTAWHALKMIPYPYAYDLECLGKYLSRELALSIRAESVVWSANKLTSGKAMEVYEPEKAEPEIFLRAAAAFADHQDYANTRMLLTAFYLHSVKPSDTDGTTREAVRYLEGRLIRNGPNMAGSPALTDAQEDELKRFLRESTADTPVPEAVWSIIRNRKGNEYLCTFLPFCAFLAVEHSGLFTALIRLAAAIETRNIPNAPLDVCRDGIGEAWFEEHMRLLEKSLPMEPERFFWWCMNRHSDGSEDRFVWKGRKADGCLRRMAQHSPELIRRMTSKLAIKDYLYLLEQVKLGNPGLYEEMRDSFEKDYRKKNAQELTRWYEGDGKEAAMKYLLGESSLDTVYPYLREWRQSWFPTIMLHESIARLSDSSEQQMCRRALVLEALRRDKKYFWYHWVPGVSLTEKEQAEESGMILGETQTDGLLRILEEEQVPLQEQLDIFADFFEGFGSNGNREGFLKKGAMAFVKRKEIWGPALAESMGEKNAKKQIFSVHVLNLLGEEYREFLLSCAGSGSRQIKDALLDIYTSHREWKSDILEMLSSKKSQHREAAMTVLSRWGADNYQKELRTAWEKEKSQKLKTALEGLLGEEGQGGKTAEEQSLDDFAASFIKNGKKRKVSMFLDESLPQVHKKNGTPASEDYMAAVLAACTGMPMKNEDAEKLAAELHKEELSAYLRRIYEKWLETGAESRKKWVLYAAALYGGEEIVPDISARILEWSKQGRGALASEAVSALVLNGTSSALIRLDELSRKSRSRQVKMAAAKALSDAAKQLQITKEELEDRLVPDASVIEAYTKRQLKSLISGQKLRLEQTFMTGRSWHGEKWKKLFVENPVMHPFAEGLIWGYYEEGELKGTFRYMEDGSFNGEDGEEYTFPRTGVIGLVHPLELSGGSLEAWKEQLSDYEIIQPLEQLDRAVYRVTEEEKNKKELTRFGGRRLSGISLSGTLRRMGWDREYENGRVDYYAFRKENEKLGVRLDISGSYLDYEKEDVTVYGVSFYEPGTPEGSFLLPGEISPRYFSEIIREITIATASCKEQLPYPECRGDLASVTSCGLKKPF